MAPRWIIGLASGAGADEVDAALLEVEGAGLDLRPRVVGALHQPYGPELRDLIRRVAGPEPCEVRQVAFLHRLLGESFAAAARAAADRASLSLQRVQCVGCSGHTAFHEAEGRFPATLALGLAAVVAERCGVTTVSDFRGRDVAAGGAGVPLAALTDYLLFRSPREGRAVLHLGATAGAVFLPAGGRPGETAGFEAGPCGRLLDGLMRRLTGGREAFDAGGKHAVQGRCLEPLLGRWLADPYLQKRPPTCLPPNAYGDAFADEAVRAARECGGGLHDLLCTATHFVARVAAGAVRRFAPARVLLGGGGVRNGLLWRLLEQQLPGVPLARTDEAGVPADARKAASFGLLAALALDGVPANVPAATGAAGPRLLGSLTPGSSANWARCLAWMAARAGPPDPPPD
jgi:anhydro-N-acetylmuramic acid kinase